MLSGSVDIPVAPASCRRSRGYPVLASERGDAPKTTAEPPALRLPIVPHRNESHVNRAAPPFALERTSLFESETGRKTAWANKTFHAHGSRVA